MPSSLIVTFTDPDEYAASVRQGSDPIVFTQRAHYREAHSYRSASILDAASPKICRGPLR